MEMMRQLVVTAPHEFIWTSIEKPTVGDNDVLMKVMACGICGSDLTYVASGGVPGMLGKLAIGHEVAGVVVAVGKNMTNVVVDERVLVNPMAAGNLIGNGGMEGAFSDYLLVRNANQDNAVYAIPDEMSFEQAALVEPMAVALHAVNQAKVTPSQKVAVFGVGPVGLGVVACLKAKGVDEIVAIDLSDQRLACAKELGAKHVINPQKSNILRALTEAHGTFEYIMSGSGTDVYIDFSGAVNVIDDIVTTLAKYQAKIVVGALYKQAVPIQMSMVLAKELTIMGSLGYPSEFPEALALVKEHGASWQKMISHRFAADEFEQAFSLAKDANLSRKVMINFK